VHAGAAQRVLTAVSTAQATYSVRSAWSLLALDRCRPSWTPQAKRF